MDYEKMYKEALEKAKIEINTKGIGETVNLCKQLFPELAESEDERIRKALVKLLTVASEAYLIHSTGIKKESYLAWLEKLAKSERVIKAARRVLNNWLDGTDCPDVSGDFVELEYAIREYDGYENQKEQKPVPFSCGHENGQPTEWSEEDENALKYIHELLVFGYTEKFMDAQTAHDMRKWVNEHLRPDTFQNGNSHWKPSEEQMEALKNSAYGAYQNGDGPALRELYEQLKNL